MRTLDLKQILKFDQKSINLEILTIFLVFDKKRISFSSCKRFCIFNFHLMLLIFVKIYSIVYKNMLCLWSPTPPPQKMLCLRCLKILRVRPPPIMLYLRRPKTLGVRPRPPPKICFALGVRKTLGVRPRKNKHQQ